MAVEQALSAAGSILGVVGKMKANADQASAEEQNASFYREQAAYAREVGDRQRQLFDDQSQVIYGDQLAGFAKAGVDTSSSSLFMAKQMLARQSESYAIKKEADFNVRLAMLRADQAQSTADSLNDPFNQFLSAAPGILQGVSSAMGAGVA
jgi:hypothetical protein